MKILITLLMLLCISSSCYALDYDKKLHIGASAVAGLAATAFVQAMIPEASGVKKFVCATALAMIPGIAKEAYDSRSGGSGWDNEDLLADFVGAAGMPATILTITWQW